MRVMMSEVEIPSVRWVGANMPAQGGGEVKGQWGEAKRNTVMRVTFLFVLHSLRAAWDLTQHAPTGYGEHAL